MFAVSHFDVCSQSHEYVVEMVKSHVFSIIGHCHCENLPLPYCIHDHLQTLESIPARSSKTMHCTVCLVLLVVSLVLLIGRMVCSAEGLLP